MLREIEGASASIGTTPRQAMMPQNCGFAAPNRLARTTECTPSAPTTSLAVTGAAASKFEFDVVRRLRQADALAAEVNGAGLFAQQRLRNHLVQVAAMDGDVRKAVALDRFHTEIEQLPALPGIPQPDRLAGRKHLDLLERVLEPERMQDTRAVGADLHPGAELAQLVRLLVDIDIDAAADERERRRKPADATADDGDFFLHFDRSLSLVTAGRRRRCASRSTKTSASLSMT